MRKVMGLLLICLMIFSGMALAEDLQTFNPRALNRNLAPTQPANRDGACWLSMFPDTGNFQYYWTWELNDAYALHLDPATNQVYGGGCTAPIYPYSVEVVEFYLYAFDAVPETQVGFRAIIDVSIKCPANNGGNYPGECSGPGDVIGHQRATVDVSYDDWNNGLFFKDVYFDAPICVSGPFFVELRLLYWDGPAGFAPGLLNGYALPTQHCKIWNNWVTGSPATYCWSNVSDDYVTPWGPYGIWAGGTSNAVCTPIACAPCNTGSQGDNAADPFVFFGNGSIPVNLGYYCSDYDMLVEVGPGTAESGSGPDVVFKLEYPMELLEYCFRVSLEPQCAEPTFFRIRSWMADSYGPFYLGWPNFPAAMKNQYYNFTNSAWIHAEPFGDGDTIPGIGCYPYAPDVIYLYVDTRNDHCVCPVLVTYEGDTPLPVELASFDAIPGDGKVTVNWRTASESDMASYEIYRDGAWVHSEEARNLATGSFYTYTDNTVENGHSYRYELRSVDINGVAVTLAFEANVTPVEAPLATEYTLYQNFPNPFNPTTSIRYAVKEPGLVSLKVYSVDGREVATLVNEVQSINEYNVTFDGANLASGVYLYTLKVNGFSSTHKMVLMK